MDQIAYLQKERNLTVILVSHSMEDIAKYVDRIVVMNKGRKMYDGEPKEVFAHYKELEKEGIYYVKLSGRYMWVTRRE